MRNITGRHKQYVRVVVEVDTGGLLTPLEVVWDDGTRYAIDAVLDVRPATSRKIDGTGMRYTVRIRGRDTYLFCEGARWFVEAKEAVLP